MTFPYRAYHEQPVRDMAGDGWALLRDRFGWAFVFNVRAHVEKRGSVNKNIALLLRCQSCHRTDRVSVVVMVLSLACAASVALLDSKVGWEEVQKKERLIGGTIGNVES